MQENTFILVRAHSNDAWTRERNMLEKREGNKILLDISHIAMLL